MSRGYFLNPEILESFMRGFFGYGNLKAPLWFVGMEEGGGNSLKEVHNRMRAWNRRGRKAIEDAAAFHIQIKMGNLFRKTDNRRSGPKIQGTWRRLILVVLSCRRDEALNNKIRLREAVREFQKTNFGRKGSCTAALELFPLPSPTRRTWNYGSGEGSPTRRWTTLPYLRTRSIYENCVIDYRIRGLQKLIAKHKPKCIILYGNSNAFRLHWRRLAGYDFPPDKDGKLIGSGPTKYLLLPHPSTHTNDQPFLNAGVEMRRGEITI